MPTGATSPHIPLWVWVKSPPTERKSQRQVRLQRVSCVFLHLITEGGDLLPPLGI